MTMRIADPPAEPVVLARAATPAPPSPRRVLVRGVRVITGAVAFVSTLLGVVFVLWPSLKPEPPPALKSATLSQLSLDQHVTFGQYLDRIDQSHAPYEPAQLARPGVLVEFDYTIKGYRGQRLPLRWQLIDSESGEQLGQSRDILITPLATSDRGTWDVWVPSPNRRAGRQFVQLQLYDRPGGVPLGRLRTGRFSGA